MKRLYRILQAAAVCAAGIFAIGSLLRCWDHAAHPERYVLMSAPWYLDIQLGACLTAALLGGLLLAMWAVKRRMR